MYMLIAESQLHWDDSEYKKENLGLFNPYDKDKVIELINNYWTYVSEDIMTEEVANGVIDLHDNGNDYFKLTEYDSIVEFESTRKEYKFSIEKYSL